MASVFGHVIVGSTLAVILQKKTSGKLILMAAICSFIPDLDVLGFVIGIDYGHVFGHRGFTHSALFALV